MTVLYGAVPPTRQASRETARRLLAFAVRDAWGWERFPPLARAPGGKPFFPGFPAFHFSLSHTGGLCLCALSAGGPVGVDCEMIRPRRAGLPRYVMSGREFTLFDGSWESFFEIWTQKEAYCKYLGRSILPPKTVPTPPPVPWRGYRGEGWRAALCGGEPLPADIRWVDEAALARAY